MTRVIRRNTPIAIMLQLLGLVQISCHSLHDSSDRVRHPAAADFLAEAMTALTERDDINVIITHRVEFVAEENGDAPANLGTQVHRHHLMTGPNGLLRLECLDVRPSHLRPANVEDSGGSYTPTDRLGQIAEEITLKAPLVVMDGKDLFIADRDSGLYHRISGVGSRKQCLEHLRTMQGISATGTRLLGYQLLNLHPEGDSSTLGNFVHEGTETLRDVRARKITFEAIPRRAESGTVEQIPSTQMSRISIWIEESRLPRPLRIEYSIGPPESPPTLPFSAVATSGHESEEFVEAVRRVERFFNQATQQITTTFEYHDPDEILRSRIQRDLADLQEVDSAQESYSRDDGRDDIYALLNQSAPSLGAMDLNGDETNLTWSDSSITILDFWATWCGPCIRAMPDLIEVQQEYADRGVRLYAVNVGESPDHVRWFLDDRDWNLEVLVDPDQEVSDAYGVNVFPTTIIIDEKGIVRSIHQGYSPQLKESLRDELDAILSEGDD